MSVALMPFLFAGQASTSIFFSRNKKCRDCPPSFLPRACCRDKGVGEFVAAARILKSRGIKARYLLVSYQIRITVRRLTIKHCRIGTKVSWNGWGFVPTFVSWSVRVPLLLPSFLPRRVAAVIAGGAGLRQTYCDDRCGGMSRNCH